MNKFMKAVFSFALLLSVALMAGCGGGSGGDPVNDNDRSNVTFNGNTSQAAINAGNVESIGTASGEAVLKADASSGIPAARSVSTSANLEQINSIILSTAEALKLPAAAESSLEICDTGSITIPNISNQSSGPLTYSIIYNNCMMLFDNESFTFNGTVVINYQDIGDPYAGFTFTYNNFTVIDSVFGTTTINMVMDCTDISNCTYSSDFVGSDGATHRVTEFSITGDVSGGFNGSATFLHSSYGEVSINVTNIIYGGSCGSIPNGGTISFSSANGSSGMIMFNADCSVSGSWDDGSGSAGSF